MNDTEKVVIYFPWKEISGGPIYLVRLAEALVKNSNYHVYYVDYEDGFSRKLISESKIEKINVSQNDFSIPIEEPITVITPIYFACWLPNIHPKSKILFVNWHVCCIPTLQNNWQISDSNIKNFLKIIAETRSVFFCDESHRLGQNRVNITFEKNIVPITLPDKNKSHNQKLVHDGEVNFVILGRLCRDKIFSVVNVLDNLNPIKLERKKIVHIIGDGPDRELIDCDKYTDLEIKFIGELIPEELTNYLALKCDCLFAMGTSVLEGAALSIPSVIIPHNMQPITCDKYVYIQESNGYCLGWYDDQFDDLKLQPIMMSEIVRDIVSVGGKESIGALAYDYYAKNHTIEEAIVLFTKAIENTTLTYSILKSCSERYSTIVKSIDFAGRSIITLIRKQYGIDANLFGRWKLFSLRNSQDPAWKIIYVGSKDIIKIKRHRNFFKFGIVESKKENIQDLIKKSNSEVILKIAELQSELCDFIKEEKLGVIDKRITKLEERLSEKNNVLLEKLDRIHYSNVIAMDTCDKLLSEESLNYFCGDIKDKYINLIKGLDEKSVEIVNRIINRIQKYKTESTCYFWSVKEEEDEFRNIMDFHSSRLTRLNNEYYAYGEYIIPCDIITSTVFYYDCFMPELLYLERYKGKNIIDAGGSFGDSALVLSKYTEEKVHVFEPTSSMYQMAEKTISENKLYSKVVLNKKALGDKKQTLNIRVERDFSTLCFDEEGTEGTEKVEVITLDEYVKENDLTVGVIKVDVEGYEEQLLLGALETIKSQKPALIFSMYHSSEQFFGIKPLIEDLNLNYTFKIRKPLDRSIIVDTMLIAEVKC
ncbi:TPA: FkbM family methyltransferase [Vibrio cholerae]|uniref:FkbM family methyltransferase n=1 Tax=Vibrio cholerae TaxID=666 RepID=UPI0011DAB552|nr:FkbM family methyltransferase [Vibrio cholerae]TXY55461.1 FkbM family methyltransferase [Vibrio cholerae]BCN18982.1 hypothetical protein [Vibrio cholerae]BCN21922.1 hypothetical protein [Vibrio cholerae]GIA22123.1 methyltransferase FkbM family protein [Vibrio cholerae]GIB32581.1 methyltransferase FkbM family protein [Vibrio cholerae]